MYRKKVIGKSVICLMLVCGTGPCYVLVHIKPPEFHIRSSDVVALLLSVSLQLVICTGKHQVAAAPVPAAKGGAAGGQRCQPGSQTRPGALL